MTNKEQKIAKIISVIKIWGGFSPNELEDWYGICVGERSFSSDSIEDYTMKYSELDDEVLDELVILCNRYNDYMLEQQEE